MGPKKSTFSRAAWSVLRLALVWARKGGALKRKNQKWLQAASRNRNKGHESDRLRYGERQLSFDETPAFHFKMHRPASMRLLSCVNPTPAVELEDYEDGDYFKWNKEEDYICKDDDNNVEVEKEKEVFSDDDADSGEIIEGCELVCKQVQEQEQEIDSKAEEFITKFYMQMKMQRQISFLQYNEMLERGCR